MATEWPTDPDDKVDPALEPLIEAGQGESEGFEQSEAALIDHARHGDQHNTTPIIEDASDVDEEATDVASEAVTSREARGRSEADGEEPRDL
jgi:hypothetical protein